MTTAWRYSGSDSVYDCNGDSGRSNDDGIATVVKLSQGVRFIALPLVL